jgi:hypothetical protein
MGREAKPPAERTPYVVSSSLVCEGERFVPLYQIYHPGEAFAIALRSGVSRRSWSGRRRTSTIERLSSNRLCQKSMAWCGCNTSPGMGTYPTPISPVFPHRNLLCQPVGESLQVDLGQVSPQLGSQRSRRSRRCGRCALGDTPKGRPKQRVAHEESSPRPDANARNIAAGNAGPATFSGAPPAAPAGDARRGCPLGGRAVRPVPAARRGYAPAGRRGTALRLLPGRRRVLAALGVPVAASQ